MRALTNTQQKVALELSHVALPDHARDCEPWEWNDGGWARLFTVREWQVGAVLIAVSGEQMHTGDVVHWLYVGGEDQLRASDRSRFAEAVAQAGSVLDSLG